MPHWIHLADRVSILVFVELAPGVHRSHSLGSRKAGFNPCFCGTRSRRFTSTTKFISRLQFQSLFLWNSLPEVIRTPIAGICGCHVSILVFVELAPGDHPSGSAPRLRLVSILVFVELAPGAATEWTSETATTCVSILVFVELAPGDPHRRTVPSMVLFQSLFLWNSLPEKDRRSTYSADDRRFQSLFLWNSLPESHTGTDIQFRRLFQSLFLWNSLPEFMIWVPGDVYV